MDSGWKTKAIVSFLFTLLGIYFVLPTFLLDDEMPEAEREKIEKWLPDSALQLGLDLKGGIHIVLGVELERALENEADQYIRDLRDILPDEKIRFDRLDREIDTTRITFIGRGEKDYDSLDIYIRDRFTVLKILERDSSKNLFVLDIDPQRKNEIERDTIRQALETLRNRLDEFGVAEPSIQAQGSNRIIVQLPGLDDPKRAEAVLGRTAQLEFKIVDDQGLTYVELQNLIKTAREKLGPKADIHAINRHLRDKLPTGRMILIEEQKDPTTGDVVETPYLLEAETLLTGDMLDDARIGMDQQNRPIVNLKFNPRGSEIFADVTTKNVKRRLAIILDDKVKSAPVLQERISGGRAQISFGTLGSRQQLIDEAKDLSLVLRAGALPAPVEILQNRLVGPGLGQDSVEKGLKALLAGLFFVIIFMALYYKLAGIVATLAVLTNLVFILAGLGGLHATLTLPGMAGIIISIGMAVDANVIIYERIREELLGGKTVKAALEAGYDRAHLTILDANLTTIITAMVLFQYGSGPIKGFALTLIFGLIANYFTALWFTRLGYEWYIAKFKPERMSI